MSGCDAGGLGAVVGVVARGDSRRRHGPTQVAKERQHEFLRPPRFHLHELLVCVCACVCVGGDESVSV